MHEDKNEHKRLNWILLYNSFSIVDIESDTVIYSFAKMGTNFHEMNMMLDLQLMYICLI